MLSNHLTSAVPFFFCLQSFPASRSFPMSQLLTLGTQSIAASASVLPMNIKGWFPLGLIGLIFSLSKGLSRVFSTTIWKHQFFSTQPSLRSKSDIHTWVLEKPQLWLIWTFVRKVMSLLFNMLSRFVTAFLPRSKHVFSWLQSATTVILEPKKIKSVLVSITGTESDRWSLRCPPCLSWPFLQSPPLP